MSTIKRIIKRNKLLIQKRKRYVRCKSKKRYTILNPIKVNEVHQMDFIGPRYIKGYGAISSMNLIDVVSNKAYIPQYAGRSMDNGAYSSGDLRDARHFSRVVRLCLCFGVEPVFIAPRKPWMDGTIEDCNGEFEEKLWARERFSDLEHLRREAKIFLTRHSNR